MILRYLLQTYLLNHVMKCNLSHIRSYAALWILFFSFILLNGKTLNGQTFIKQQLSYPRVRQAYANKAGIVQQKLRSLSLDTASIEVQLRGYKTEKQLEIRVRKQGNSSWTTYATFDICAASGGLGPKIKQGDLQVPEGLYFIDRFNPVSAFHLSLGISYPNAQDKKRSAGQAPGGDIFIHGECASIGCLAMTNPVIEEIYLLCIWAKTAGQKQIPVQLYPFQMSDSKLNTQSKSPWFEFWKSLQMSYKNK